MVDENWQTDWTAFVNYVARSIDNGETVEALSASVSGQHVHWKGHIAQLRLDTEYARGVTLKMHEVRHTLNSGFTLIGRHLFLKVDDETQRQRLREFKVGDFIDFYSTVAVPNQVFNPLQVAYHADQKTAYIEISMRGADIVSS